MNSLFQTSGVDEVERLSLSECKPMIIPNNSSAAPILLEDGPKHSCPFCRRTFIRDRELRGHLATRHNAGKEFRCSICGREYSYKRSLVGHMNARHGGNW